MGRGAGEVRWGNGGEKKVKKKKFHLQVLLLIINYKIEGKCLIKVIFKISTLIILKPFSPKNNSYRVCTD